MSKFLVPVFDLFSLECSTVAVSAPNECAAVWQALHHSPSLRYTGGKIERIEIDPEMSVARDVWDERWRPAREKV
jgi:hypothetical protein